MALLILWLKAAPDTRTPASVPSAALSFVSTLGIYPLSYMEQTRNIRPSTLLEAYLLASMVLDIPQARTLFLLRHSSNTAAIGAIFTASMGVKLVLWMLEAQSKTKHLKHAYKEYPPEATRGICNRTFFWWLNPLLLKGFRSLLSMEDLYTTDPALSSKLLGEKMQTAWDQQGKTKTLASSPLARRTHVNNNCHS